jgi:hypothetical protein
MDERFKKIFSCITGSQLYGTATPESDTDVRGVFIPTEEFYFGFMEKVEQVESHVPDETYWEITKFFKLCLDNNPNILELLFIPKEFTLGKTEEWDRIMEHRDLFLSTKARHTFSGYAVSQLHRIKQHREWLLNPPAKKPERRDFNLPETNVITKDQINAYDELLDRGEILEIGIQTLQVLQREKAYFNAMKYWDNYQRWKAERNKDRASLEAKFGYDTKHASHLFRLMGEGIELLTTGNITFPRPDADELLAIRHGKYSYEELMSKLGIDVDSNFKSIEDKIILPHNPDRKKADKLCQMLVKERLGY